MTQAVTRKIKVISPTRYQIDDIYFLAGIRGVDEKSISLEMFNLNLNQLNYHQAEKLLGHIRSLPRLEIKYETCIGCGNASQSQMCFYCRTGFTKSEYQMLSRKGYTE